MNVIWKFSLPTQETTLEMPIGACVLSAHSQGDDICLWALVDPNAQKEPRKFIFVGTGHDISEKRGVVLVFIDTVHLRGGSNNLVFHVFEATKKFTR